MAVTKVVVKNSEIDGKPITWNVLAITGYLNGEFNTLELKLTKTEAMLAGLLLSSDNVEVGSRKASSDEQEDFLKQNQEDDTDWNDEIKGKKK